MRQSIPKGIPIILRPSMGVKIVTKSADSFWSTVLFALENVRGDILDITEGYGKYLLPAKKPWHTLRMKEGSEQSKRTAGDRLRNLAQAGMIGVAALGAAGPSTAEAQSNNTKPIHGPEKAGRVESTEQERARAFKAFDDVLIGFHDSYVSHGTMPTDLHYTLQALPGTSDADWFKSPQAAKVVGFLREWKPWRKANPKFDLGTSTKNLNEGIDPAILEAIRKR